MDKIKIEDIPRKISFKELQEQLILVASAINRMENEEIGKDDLYGWNLFLSIRITTTQTLVDLLKDYNHQMQNKENELMGRD